MPRYSFACASCARVMVLNRPVADRDDPQVDCLCGGRLVRQVDAPAFAVKGFKAANGYATPQPEPERG